MRPTRSTAWLVLALLLAARAAPAQLPVFSGDPTDPSSGDPYTILPGVGLVLPGDDEKYETEDDVINGSIVGDVDVVVRTGGGYAGGAIPAPSAGIAAAPAIVAGGQSGGTEAAFQVIVSDGASSPAAGNPLLGAQHDARGALVLVFPDLDGDGIVGPHNGDGNSDNEVERQESLTIIGRQLGAVESGVASGSVGVVRGAPPTSGGLGAIVVAGVLMGTTAPTYFDGPWVSTRLPIMPPVDPERLIGGGGGVRAPEAGEEYLVEIKTEFEEWFLPSPSHPVLGTPYAIPTDGSSITVDIARCESGPATGAALGLPVSAGGFVADPARRILAGVAPGGGRLLIESVSGLGVPDDGPGNGRTVYVFAADLMGNPADVAGPMTVVVETNATLNITSPDTDSDLHRETLTLTSATAVAITVDDAGGSGDGSPNERLVATVGGVPTASVRAFAGGVIACGNGVVEAGEECDDGNLVDGDGCQADCTTTPQDDAIVFPLRALGVKIGEGETSVSRRLRVKVRSGDPRSSNHQIKLVAQDGTCPAGTVAGLPAFANSVGPIDTVALDGGRTASAEVPLSIVASSFTPLNGKAPARCRVELSVQTIAGSGVEPTPANNSVGIEINVSDDNDAEQATAHESHIDSVKPLRVKIGRGKTSKTKVLSVTVANDDIVPQAEEPGHTVSVTVDQGDCPAGTLGPPDLDSGTPGAQSSASIEGGRRVRAQAAVTISAAAFDTVNAKSPARCTASITVSGPGGDADASNDTTELTIDVVDGNDF